MTNLPGILTTSGSPYDIFLADLDNLIDGPDVMYVADEGNNGLSKYSLVGGTWVSNGKIGSSADQPEGSPEKDSLRNCIVCNEKEQRRGSRRRRNCNLIDAGGYNAPFSGTPVVLATAAPNTLIRGIAMSPGSLEK